MKSALTHVLFLLFEICVFGDADIETVSVTEGDAVTLHTDVTEIQSSDLIEWRLNGSRIALISGKSIITEGPSRDRLKLDTQTGDLKITDIKTNESGEYKLKIRNTKGSSEKTISVSVVPADPVKTVSVMVGDSVTLNTGVTEPQRYDVIQWRFGHLNSPIAEINRKTRNAFTSNTDERFRGRLQLNDSTGSLTIRNTETTHSGDYEYDISTSSHTIHRPFTVTVSGEMKSALSVIMGDSVFLNSDLTEIQTDDLMQWMFGDSQIAEIYKAGDRFSTSDDRLKLDHQTGSLTITDTRTTDSGLYELEISSRRRTVLKRMTVAVARLSPGAKAGIGVGVVVVLLVCVAAAAGVIYYRRKNSKLKAWSSLSVMEGETVHLIPYGTEIHEDEDIWWRFGDATIAERKAVDKKITINDDVLGGRFKGRLHLDTYSGFLTIKDITTTDSGRYELLSSRSEKNPLKTFSVSVFAETDMKTMLVNEGESVTLKTGVTDIKKDDEIQWKFRLYDSPIAQIRGGTRTISSFSAGWRFIFRLKLDHQTGSLTIKKIKRNHTGFYELHITDGGNTSMKLFKVKVLESTDNRNKPEENVPLNHVP